MITKLDGQLEIHHDRGVIYFHATSGICVLRICGLPAPIPDPGKDGMTRQLDVAHLCGTDWGPITSQEATDTAGRGFATEKRLRKILERWHTGIVDEKKPAS